MLLVKIQLTKTKTIEIGFSGKGKGAARSKTDITGVELFSGERAGHSRKRFVVQVYLAPSRISSFGARIATVRDLPSCFNPLASAAR